MSDSDNFGSDLESDSLGSHLGASDEEVDECSAVNAVRMQPTLDPGGPEPEDWGRLKTLDGRNYRPFEGTCHDQTREL